MKKIVNLLGFLFLLTGLLALIFFFVQEMGAIPILNPKGMIGLKQKELIVTATWLMLIVVIPVFLLTIFVSWRYRKKNAKAKYAPNWDSSWLAELVWWGVPCIIIFFLSILVWKSSYELDPFKPIDSEKKTLKIQAVALNWKWLFIYPEQGIATLNYVQFPEKTPLVFEITADAPMNSFWIPQLGGQIYAMAGMKTKLHLIADEVGVFRGSSSNFSGKGFSGMTFVAEAATKEQFDSWVDESQSSSNQLDLEEYNRLVEPSENDPKTIYVLKTQDLYDQIIMKYGMPMSDTHQMDHALKGGE